MNQLIPKVCLVFLLLFSCTVIFAGVYSQNQPLSAGQGVQGPWWMQQTAMTPTGKLTLTDKPWWNQALKLKIGDNFVIECTGPVKGRMLVKKEKIKRPRHRKEITGIVWVIDDDSDSHKPKGFGDQDSDCYVVDYNADGIVDRMVDYIDNDGDNDPDEMEIRHFVDGYLRYAWFGVDLDDDSIMWKIVGYEYGGGHHFFESDPYGDSMIYMNKLNSQKGQWSPFSECPFAFYDTDQDGFSETVIRVSAVPIKYDTSVDPDYANDFRRITGNWTDEMEQMGIVNIRYSFDVDNGSCAKTPLHYDFGFNLVGASPYKFPQMEHHNPRRRPPQVTCVIPWKNLPNIADNFQANQTGLSWHENYDDTIAIGYADQKEKDYRWEGVFWIWERR